MLIGSNIYKVRRSSRLIRKRRVNYNYNRFYNRKKSYEKTKKYYCEKCDLRKKSDYCDNCERQMILWNENKRETYYCEKCNIISDRDCSGCNNRLYRVQDFDEDEKEEDERSFHTEDYTIDSSEDV
jgi:hypothetical protein